MTSDEVKTDLIKKERYEVIPRQALAQYNVLLYFL